MYKQFFILTILFVIVASCGNKDHSEKEEQKSSKPDMSQYVTLGAVEKMTASSTISAIGIVISKSKATPSFKTGGVIQKTYAKEGDTVKKGQILATLLMTEINAQVDQAKEGLSKANRDLQRAQNLYADSVATLEQVQNAKTGVSLSVKNLEIAQFNSAHSEVRAPISGRIIQQIMHTGEIAGPGHPVYVIMGVSNNDWKVTANLIDSEWAKISTGDPVDIKFDAYPNQIFKGKVSNKAIIAADASGALEVEFSFITPPPALAVGLVSKVIITPAQSHALMTIPIEAIVKSDGNSALVYIIENKRAKRMNVQIAKLMGDKVAISSGLEGIDKVVTIGAIFLEDGDEVIVTK